MSTTQNNTLTVGIVSFDEIAAKYTGDQAEANRLAKIKIKKEMELSSQVKQAKLAVMDAEEALEKAIITDGSDIAQAAAILEKKQNTAKFYEELYNKVFPNA